MKKIVQFIQPATIILFVLVSCQNEVKTASDVNLFNADSVLISDAFNAQLKAWNEGSIDGFMAAYHRDTALKFITSKGITFGWNQVRNNYLKSFPNQEKMGTLNFVVDGYDPMNDSIMNTTGVWMVSYPDTSRSGYFSLFWKKFPDHGWKIIIDHTW